MRITRLKYTFQVFQKDHFWLPIAIMALFVIISIFIAEDNRYNTVRAFLGFVLPLISGGLSAYGFLADSALELQFTTSRSAWHMIFERLGMVFSAIILTSLTFQFVVWMMGVSLSPLDGLFLRQLVWFVPSLTMLTLGGAASLIARNSNGGFALVGGIWITQLILRGWFARKPILRNILIFYGVMDPLGNHRFINYITLLGISILLLWFTKTLLSKQERYI